MSLSIEGLFGKPNRDVFKPYPVEPNGARRRMFLANAADYLNAPEFTGDRFNRFCEAMIYAMDGTQVSPTTSVAEWTDIRTDQTLLITRSREWPWNFAGITLGYKSPMGTVFDENLTFGSIVDTSDAKTGEPVPTIKDDAGLVQRVYVTTLEETLRICKGLYDIYTRGSVRSTTEIHLNQRGYRTRERFSMFSDAA